MQNWVENFQKEALKHFDSLAFPSTKNEDFKYTDVKKLNYPDSQEAQTKLPDIFTKKNIDESALLSFQTSFLREQIIDKDLLDKGVIFCDLLTAVEKYPELLEKYGKRYSGFAKDKFAQMAYAKWENGVFLYIPKHLKIEKALRASQFLAKAAQSNYFYSLIVVDSGAQVEFIDDFASEASSSELFINGVLHLHLESQAKCKYVQLQNFAKETNYFLRQLVDLSTAAEAELSYIGSGAKKGQQLLEVAFNGEHSVCKLQGAVRGSGKQHFDFVANLMHQASHTRGELDFWSIMDEQAKGVFNGILHVKKATVGTDSYQKNYCLLLSEKASLHSMPKLIIATDEVACQHGTSITRINPEQLYYLQSRGIDSETAEQMIVDGFVAPVISSIATASMRKRVQNLLLEQDILVGDDEF